MLIYLYITSTLIFKMMLGRKRGAERTSLLAERFEMLLALPKPNFRGGSCQFRKKGWGAGKVSSSSRASEQVAGQTAGWMDGQISRVASPGLAEGTGGRGVADGTAQDGTAWLPPRDPHPRRLQRWVKVAGGRASAACLNCAHWALPWPARERAAVRLPGGEDLRDEPGGRWEPAARGRWGRLLAGPLSLANGLGEVKQASGGPLNGRNWCRTWKQLACFVFLL